MINHHATALNLASVLEHQAILTPDRVAVTSGDTHITYASLEARASQLAAGLHAHGVLIGAGDDVDGAADQCLQRLRTAAEIIDGDLEALLLEVSEPLADRQRQIVERGLAADGERDLFLFDGLGVCGGAERKRAVDLLWFVSARRT